MKNTERTLLLVKVALTIAVTTFSAICFHHYAEGDADQQAIRDLSRSFGQATMAALVVTLSISPLREIFHWHVLLRLRRTCGLLTFALACQHLLCFVLIDHELDLRAMAAAIVDKPGTGIGLIAFLLLLPLAFTSNRIAQRRLGGPRWQELHRSLYVIAMLAEIHYLWQAEGAQLPLAVATGVVLAGLLLWRARRRIDSYQRVAPPPGPRAQVIQFYKKRP